MTMKLNWRGILATLATALAISPFIAPEVLAFPHHADFGADRVWSVEPIPRAQMAAVLADANTRAGASPLAKIPEGRRIFLTDGGWRWRVLALQNSSAIALTRAFREDVIISQTDIASGKIFLSQNRSRSISSVIAHEKCHGMVRRRYGVLSSITKPTWLVEGYCDHVGQESTLNANSYAALKRADPGHRAILYYEGRQRVAAILARNGNDVGALFAMKPGQ